MHGLALKDAQWPWTSKLKNNLHVQYDMVKTINFGIQVLDQEITTNHYFEIIITYLLILTKCTKWPDEVKLVKFLDVTFYRQAAEVIKIFQRQIKKTQMLPFLNKGNNINTNPIYKQSLVQI